MIEPVLAPAGDRGVFVELGAVSLAELQGAAAAVRPTAHSRAWIVGHGSLLGLFDSAATTYAAFVSAVHEALRAAVPDDTHGASHSIPVSFSEADAPDLPALLDHAKMTRDGFLAAIEGLSLRARFLGFRPGFAYLEGIPPAWQLPRRATSRRSVPAGSFAVAGAMGAFYPADSPGGWNLVGRTAMPLWDTARRRPNLIAAGDEVRIVAAGPASTAPHPTLGGAAVTPPAGPRLATVRSPGQLTLVVSAADERRCEWGLPPGGPFDVRGAASANAAVGNSGDATLLECAGVGPTLEAHKHLVLSWFGADVTIHVDRRPIDEPRLFEASPGEVVEIGPLRNGLRGLLAVRGGIANPAGPHAVAPHALRRGEDVHRGAGAPTERGRLRALERGDRRLLQALRGPHRTDAKSLEWIATSRWTVSPAIDRTGLRLQGDGRHPPIPAGLPSCGMQFGTVQCHPNGDLVVMGPDHPVTGGYVQPITILSADLWKLGQLLPGDHVRWQILE